MAGSLRLFGVYPGFALTVWLAMQDKGERGPSMAFCRILLAGLIAFAVAVAPVSATLAAAHVTAKASMHDCHGKSEKHCPNCQKVPHKLNCPGDGAKCCKLVGTISTSSEAIRFVAAADLLAQPQRLRGWFSQPETPPPRF
jgi:hypothetical protein